MDFGKVLRRGFWVLVCLLAIGTTATCGKTERWNQKLTIEVETPDGLKTGSSVIEVTLDETKWGTPEMRGVSTTIKGEATVVEVAPGKFLVALLRTIPTATFVYFPDEAPIDTASKLRKDFLEKELSLKQYPNLVTFKDANDPKSVEAVNPSNLSAIFGQGYSIRRMTFSVTTDKVTSGDIEKALPWLKNMNGGMLDGSTISYLSAPYRLANDLSELDFMKQ